MDEDLFPTRFNVRNEQMMNDAIPEIRGPDFAQFRVGDREARECSRLVFYRAGTTCKRGIGSRMRIKRFDRCARRCRDIIGIKMSLEVLLAHTSVAIAY